MVTIEKDKPSSLLSEIVAEVYEVLEKVSPLKTSFLVTFRYTGLVQGLLDLKTESIAFVFSCINSSYLAYDSDFSFSTSSAGFHLFTKYILQLKLSQKNTSDSSNNPSPLHFDIHNTPFHLLQIVINVENAFGLISMPVHELVHHPALVSSLVAGLILDEPME